ncbi:MAG TPA: ceramide glucosyltransferase [Xanthobacteraceae bacterium]|nr:ceramide glucosyltransferase [Xanthobacteraceae bacterium]
MNSLIWFLAGTSAIAAIIHLTSIVLTTFKLRVKPVKGSSHGTPPVSVVRPVCGLDADAETTLRSTFHLDYPGYEVIFCVASPNDPVVPLIRKLIAEYSGVRAQLLTGDDPVSENPKLNNCVKGWRAAAHDWIVLSDSNVILPPDYLQRLFEVWGEDTGLVCAPPVGGAPQSIPAEFECVFLNEYQARWQYFADQIGAGFAQGKSMLWRRDLLETNGGIAALGAETAEDAASTKIVREAGLMVRLADSYFVQPLGRRSVREVWARQVRWARLRRVSFPFCFALEIFSGGIWPSIVAGVAAHLAGLPWLLGLGFAALWYGAEAMLARALGWHWNWRSPLLCAFRDLILPALWLEGWRGRNFQWRGNAMVAAPNSAG